MTYLRGPRVHLLILALYAVLVPVSIATGWIYSVPFVSALSIWALVESRLGTYKAAVVAQAQADDANVQDVIDRLDAQV